MAGLVATPPEVFIAKVMEREGILNLASAVSSSA